MATIIAIKIEQKKKSKDVLFSSNNCFQTILATPFSYKLQHNTNTRVTTS